MWRRVAIVLAAVLVWVGLPASADAAAIPPDDCSVSARHFPTLYNGLGWSDSDMTAWHTPTRRAGACGSVYIEFLGVYNAPACAYFKLVTYHEDRTRNYIGPWFKFERIGQLANIRAPGTISNGRLYRVYGYGCGRFRHPNHPVGMNVYTHAL